MPNDRDYVAAFREAGTVRGAAKILKCCPRTVKKKLQNYTVQEEPRSESLTAAEIIEYRKKQFNQLHRAKEAEKRIIVSVHDEGPIGILHMGDPHVDDQGTDLETLYSHADIIKNTKGMYGACIGDVTNNWIGNLKRLYAEQSTSEADGWLIAEDFLNRVDWLYMIYGNHDCWSGSSNPLDWILKHNNGVVKDHRCRLRLTFPNNRNIDIFAAHNFKGHSQWNKAHGVAKAAQMGYSDHILINGHTHVSAYNKVVSRDPTLGIDGGRISHCIQIASYKIYDSYAESLGLDAHSFSPCCVTIIDPHATKECNLIQVFDDPEHAAEYLTWLRTKGKK